MRRPSPALRSLSACAAVLALAAASRPAAAEGTSLRANLVEPRSVKLDGVPKEWSGLSPLSYALKGRSAKPDFEARAAVAYDNTNVYIAADVTDDVLKPGGDHLEVVVGFPGGSVDTVLLYPGDPGKSPGAAKSKDGSAIAGARVVEAPRTGGWSLEASVPWSAFPQSKLVRVGLRGAIFAHDADSGGEKNVTGTAPSPAYASLPPINTETEQSLAEGLIKDKGIRGAPRFNLLGDVAGDSMKERVLIFDRYLVVLGSNFRKGTEYYWSDIGVEGERLPSCEVRDLTGDGQAEIILRKRLGSGSKYREMVQVLSFGPNEVPLPIFQHELAIVADGGSITNEIAFVSDGGKAAIKITPGAAKGFDAGSYHEPTESSYDPALLPWGSIASQTYKWNGKEIAKVAEEKQAASATPAAPAAQEAAAFPKAPPPPSASELLEKVYDLYKRDRGASGRPRFDLAVDVGGDKQAERVLVHDRDLVIFGKGWKGGTGYTFLTLSQFASPADLLDLTARDVTGDGKAEIIVKGVMHGSAPREAGGGTVDREVVMVYQVAGEGLRRIFAAETARAIGRKRVQGNLAFLSGGEIEIAPGKAVEWSEKTYPFNQDPSAMGGIEPLLLPWGGSRPLRYRWAGSGFSH